MKLTARELGKQLGRSIVARWPHEAHALARALGNGWSPRLHTVNVGLRQSLKTAFSELTAEQMDALVRKYWRSKFERWVEQMRVEAMSPAQLSDYAKTQVEIRGAEHLRQSVENQRPVIVFTPHYGHFILGTLRLQLELKGRKQLFLFYNPPEKNPYTPTMRRLFDSVDAGTVSVYNNRPGMLRVARGLRSGAMVGIMPDVYELTPTTAFVPFCGRLMIAMEGTAFLAVRFGAQLLPMYCTRAENGRFTLGFDPLISPHESDSLEEDIYETTATIIRNMEAHIRAAPEHWVYWESFMARTTDQLMIHDYPGSWRTELDRLTRYLGARNSHLLPLLRSLDARLAAVDSVGGVAS